MRSLFGRCLTAVFAIALCLALAPAVVAEESGSVGTITVDAQDPSTWPSGSDEMVDAVQNAVDTYDVVYLEGTFDFEGQVVDITHSVQILGAGADALGNYGTRILDGGYGAFSSSSNEAARIVVRDIEFDGPEAALFVTRSELLEMTGCRVSSLSAPWGGIGVEVSSEFVTGRVIIEGNHFDISSPESFSIGFFAQSVLADIEVHDNLVENFHSVGIWANSAGNIDVSENTVAAGPTEGNWPYRNGIIAGSWFLPSGDRGNLEVADNTITMGGPMEQGIALQDFEQEERDVCEVADNEITYVEDSPGGHGILLLSQFSNCEFDKNTIDGEGHELASGIALFPAVDPSADGGVQEGNTFSKNEVRNATLDVAGFLIHISAQAQHNAFVKNKLKAVDGDGFLVQGDYNQFDKNQLADIGGTGFVVDGDYNQFDKNQLKEVATDGFLLLGDNNLLKKNKLKDIGGDHVVDPGEDNRVER